MYLPNHALLLKLLLLNLLPCHTYDDLRRSAFESVQDDAVGDVRNVNMNNGRGRCSYKEFLACNPKDFDGKGGVIPYTCWTRKIEYVQDMSGCGDHQKVKYASSSVIGRALTY
ncbi:hypothetical protein Tco_1212825 [Tanacetum coccineum]